MALTRKGVTIAWTDRQQVAFDTLKSCLLNIPILGFPTEDGQFILDTDTSLFAVGGVLNGRRIGRSLLRTLARAFGCLSGGIAWRSRRCWQRSSLPGVLMWCSVHSAYGSQFTSVIAEILE